MTAAPWRRTCPVRPRAGRKLKSWIDYAVRSGRQADAHLLVPDLRLLAEFAADTLVHHQIQSLDGYATVLNKEAAALAETLEDSHPLRAQLVANDGKPWSQPNCRRILDIYLEQVFALNFAEKVAAGNQPNQPSKEQPGGRKRRRTSARASSVSVAAPLGVLDKMLSKAKDATLSFSRLDAKAIPQGASREVKAEAAAHAAARKAAGDAVGMYAACFLALAMMARASTVGGNKQFNPNPDGVYADLNVDEAGLTYVIRFLKGWRHGVHSFRGDKLPIARDGADTFPWERDSKNSLKKNSPRNAVLELLQFAHKHRLLDALNRDSPGSMEGKMNSFLREQHFTDILRAETKVTSI